MQTERRIKWSGDAPADLEPRFVLFEDLLEKNEIEDGVISFK